MSTLVLTSVNPSANIHYQKTCLNEWERLGYQVRSFNHDSESRLLISAGFTSSQIREISPEKTSIKLFDRPIPRILPLLEEAVRTDHNYFVLTNSDIFPAHRSVVSSFLERSYQAVACTRTEVYDLALSRQFNQVFYRGGLDIFWFSRSGLLKILPVLQQSNAASRMTFGIPGWDFYLGHVVRTHLGAPIMDGTIFLHKAHVTTYDSIDEFGHYTEEMFNSGAYASRGTTQLAYEFSMLIRQQCIDHQSESRLLNLAYYSQPELGNHEKSPGPETKSIQRALIKFIRLLAIAQCTSAFQATELNVILSSQKDSADWESVSKLVNYRNRRQSYFCCGFQALLISLLCLTHSKRKKIRTNYPAGNKHIAALRMVVSDKCEQSREKAIFHLFATELLAHGILNLNILKYLYTACNSVDEKALLSLIISICKHELNHAKASETS